MQAVDETRFAFACRLLTFRPSRRYKPLAASPACAVRRDEKVEGRKTLQKELREARLLAGVLIGPRKVFRSEPIELTFDSNTGHSAEIVHGGVAARADVC